MEGTRRAIPFSTSSFVIPTGQATNTSVAAVNDSSLAFVGAFVGGLVGGLVGVLVSAFVGGRVGGLVGTLVKVLLPFKTTKYPSSWVKIPSRTSLRISTISLSTDPCDKDDDDDPTILSSRVRRISTR